MLKVFVYGEPNPRKITDPHVQHWCEAVGSRPAVQRGAAMTNLGL